jgi:hypothetical protein
MIWLILQGALVGWLAGQVFLSVDGWLVFEFWLTLIANSSLVVLYGLSQR